MTYRNNFDLTTKPQFLCAQNQNKKKMLLRKNILPKAWPEAAVTAFLFVMIPVIYYFELFVVLPAFYEIWSPWYLVHFTMGNFILFNVCANLVGIIIFDTSIKGKILPSEGGPNWRFCSVCEVMAPPRSWHCKTCNTCILKRDHHCMFTSCCIGLYNHRHFVVFLVYLFIALVYGSCYNLPFIRSKIRYESWTTVLKFIFPLAAIFVEWTENQIHIFLVLLQIVCGFLAGTILYIHIEMMLTGAVSHERKNNVKLYDRGMLENVKVMLGERWYLVLFSPFIESTLPVDGITWDIKESTKYK